MKLLEILTGGKATEIISTVGDAIDKNIYSKEEKAQDALKAEELANETEERRIALDQEELNKRIDSYIKLTELDVENTKDARAREVSITQSEHSSWLQKNIMPLLAIIIIGYTFILWTLILFRNYEPKTNESMIIGSLSTISVTVISYYFGSSLSSAKKDEFLKK
jgi:uncharacterized membrane protein YcjF (UPF0283 family)